MDDRMATMERGLIELRVKLDENNTGIAVIGEQVKQVKQSVDEMHATLKDHNGRLRRGEEWMKEANGALKMLKWFFVPVAVTLTIQVLSPYIVPSTSADAKLDQKIEEQLTKLLNR